MNNLNKKILLLQSVYIGMCYFCTGYAVQALQRFGFNNKLIGITMMLTALVSAIAQPLWGHISDRTDKNKQIVAICCVVTGIFYFGFIFSGGRVPVVIVTILVMYALFQPMLGLIDSWVSKLIIDGNEINYSATRAGGSFAYAVTALVFGAIIARYGMFVTPFFYTLFCAILLVVLFSIPNSKAKSPTHNHSIKKSIAYLVTNSRFVAYSIAYFFTSITSVIALTYYSVVLFSMGGNELHVGIGLFLSAMSEIPTLIFYEKIKDRTGLSASQLLAISMFFYALKSAGIAFAGNIPIAIVANMLHGVSFGLFLPASLDFLMKIVDRKHFSTAYMISISIGSSLPSLIANLAGGIVSDGIGVQNMLKLSIIFAIIGALIIIISQHKYKEVDYAS